jgi:hypothetical protein
MGFHHIDIRFPNTRKPRRCVVYPVRPTDQFVTVQGDDCIARLSLIDGSGTFAVNANGAYFHHLMTKGQPVRIDEFNLERLRAVPKSEDGTVQIGGK